MANKRTKLNKAELYYIQQNPNGLNAQEIAELLDVSETKVSQVLSKERHKNKQLEKENQPPEKPQKINKMEGLIQTTSDREIGRGRKGVAIIGAAGSQRIDEANRIARQNARKPEHTPHLAKIYPDRDDSH